MYTLKLLIVDDEPGMRRGAARALMRHTFTAPNINTEFKCDIKEAENGTDALELLANNEFDLLLLDFKLPDMSGLDILDIIKEKKYNVLIVMMTAYASLNIAVSTMKHGAFDFLSKPFTPEELRNIVSKLATNIILSKQARKLEEEKRQVRFEFISVLSHELKAPINAVEGYLNLIDSKMLGDDLASYNDMVKRSIVRINNMKKLIFDILDLTRIESKQKKREITEVDISSIAETCIETYSVQAKERNITFETDFPEHLYFTADKTEIEIIFNNLISNAVKYNKDGGKVIVKLSGNIDSVTIKVSDTGIGLKPEEKEKLFGEFVRIKNEKTRSIEGSGLGLSILKKLAALYHGDIQIESEYEKGTSFALVLKKTE